MSGVSFPQLAARDLDGREVALAAGLPGERDVVLIAFRSDQQKLADTWVPWLEQRAATDPGLRFVEVPTIGLRWEPARWPAAVSVTRPDPDDLRARATAIIAAIFRANSAI